MYAHIFHDPVTNTDTKITSAGMLCKDAVRAKHFMDISEAYDNLMKVSTGDYTSAQREASRKVLNELYDKFVDDKTISNKPNRLNDRLNEALLSEDIDYWRVAGFERYDTGKKEYVKSDILTKDTLVYRRPEHADANNICRTI